MNSTVITARIRRMGEGNSFSLLVCPQGGGGTYPGQEGGRGNPSPARSGWGRVTPRYLPPAKVPTPWPGQDGGGGIPRYLPTSQVRTGDGVVRSTTPGQVRMGEGVAKVPNHQPGQDGGGSSPRYLSASHVRTGEAVAQGTIPHPSQVRMGGGRGYPKVPNPLPPAKVLLHGGRYASCIYAGLSCSLIILHRIN